MLWSSAMLWWYSAHTIWLVSVMSQILTKSRKALKQPLKLLPGKGGGILRFSSSVLWHQLPLCLTWGKHWFQPYSFPASPCSVYHWTKCSSLLLRVVLLYILDWERRAQAPRVTSVFHWYDWLPPWIPAGIMSTENVSFCWTVLSRGWFGLGAVTQMSWRETLGTYGSN